MAVRSVSADAAPAKTRYTSNLPAVRQEEPQRERCREEDPLERDSRKEFRHACHRCGRGAAGGRVRRGAGSPLIRVFIKGGVSRAAAFAASLLPRWPGRAGGTVTRRGSGRRGR
ncbi:hypothetical protein GCM10010347_43170 [Streptomyces cirratus]|uniref:Uncharacterized protein n=1 Tax=Streptomyces cirratus TaxID=68187 RepID=A0ABQ3F0B9_9ACTN|nr:hypothetical protein GCM10010347_43170 [Streptomyces cirratus]